MQNAMKPIAIEQSLDLDAYWMPFTHNQRFKKQPKLIAEAQGAYYFATDGRKLFDALSGLWCCNAGHGHPRIVEAVQKQVAKLDYATAFQFGHPEAFRLAARLAELAPGDLNHAFFTNSGSESVDTALKMAVAYHRIRGEGERVRFIGREKGYHGVGFGGISVGGIVPNRKMFAPVMVPGVDHLPHTHSLEHMAFSRGQPEWGAHLADELERIVALHDPSTVAAVIVEPMQGSAGVIVPPVAYLERLREICDRHGILLIFDEVICGFGRLGENFGAHRFEVTPDLMTFAKGVTNGVVPMGGVIAKEMIHETFMSGPENLIEFFHGYTYSGHPLAVAAAHATLDVYQQEDLFSRARALEPILEDAVHSLRGKRNVVDIRNIGFAAAIDLAPLEEHIGQRGKQVFDHAFEHGAALRVVADTIAIAPPFITEAREIDRLIDIIGNAIDAVT
ncbi:MAG: aspartate aminotransferase family protein [Pseudomonadota bacterium]